MSWFVVFCHCHPSDLPELPTQSLIWLFLITSSHCVDKFSGRTFCQNCHCWCALCFVGCLISASETLLLAGKVCCQLSDKMALTEWMANHECCGMDFSTEVQYIRSFEATQQQQQWNLKSLKTISEWHQSRSLSLSSAPWLDWGEKGARYMPQNNLSTVAL